MPRPTDEELVARHLGGDPDAFAELVRRFTAGLFNLAYRFTGDSLDAEDIAQESFLRALRALPRSRLDRPFKPWLYQIALNLCRDRARRRQSAAFADLGGADDGCDEPAEMIPDEAPLPPDICEAHEMEAALRQAVMDLPEADRLLLTLRYNEALSYDEIGHLLDLPAATVGTHLFRAKRRLHTALAAFAAEAYA